MSDKLRWCLVLPLALCASLPALAQGTITDGPAEFVRGTSPWDTSPNADFRGVSTTPTQDHLFETGWWFRIEGDTQEFFFPVPDSQSYVGDTSIITWNDVNARGLLSAVETSTVVDTLPVYGSASGYTLMILQVTNLRSSNPLDVEIFHFVDFDIAGAGSDSAVLAEWTPLGIIALSDPSGNAAHYAASSEWTGYMVTPFGAGDVAAQLSDASVTNFTNTGLPFGPGDFVGGWQYSLSLGPLGSKTIAAVLMVNATGYCDDLLGILCDGFEAGDTSIWSSTVP